MEWDVNRYWPDFYYNFLVKNVFAGGEKLLHQFAGTSDPAEIERLVKAGKLKLHGLPGTLSSQDAIEYEQDYKTSDSVATDYVALAQSVEGVKGLFGGYNTKELLAALQKAHTHQGLSVIHLPVYYGENELGGLGAFGSWNVGNWCEEVQKEHHQLGL